MSELSHRLSVIASLVPYGARVCDIGTDHGYLPIYLAEHQIAKTIIACDMREKPLENARKNIELSGAKGIELRLCDGLSGINKDEVDTVVIAGMGGEVISGILSRCDWIKKSDNIKLILQPTTSAEELRRWLNKNGFEITKEPTVAENGKLYSVMITEYTGATHAVSEAFFYVGNIDPTQHSGFLYIKKQLDRLKKCADSLAKIPQKQEEYLYYKQVSDSITQLLSNTGIKFRRM